MEDGITVRHQTDELTGLTNIEILDPKDRPAAGKDLRPAVRLVDAKGNVINIEGTDQPAQYFLPPGSITALQDNANVGVGEVVGRIPQES
ncbi:UNVERIFIED_CONTAM: hypothetical protein LI959_09510, partial [Campylobacter jejuni]